MREQRALIYMGRNVSYGMLLGSGGGVGESGYRRLVESFDFERL
jgi:hypothetical protein